MRRVDQAELGRGDKIRPSTESITENQQLSSWHSLSHIANLPLRKGHKGKHFVILQCDAGSRIVSIA